eukprot:CAMPEP_0183732376 /NCGR_PEP_ID=MMETSP0737-20130205/38310_1 /TAXON_ID=385413 /ORGANISM="Thalassiosira miniscula, Strain CCMP1093" /LENGTH=355 /DNA_ID=CAMNT_0025965383 /DNA_START=137 /DNA_END=1204 /DNA_ORIENTATION=+
MADEAMLEAPTPSAPPPPPPPPSTAKRRQHNRKPSLLVQPDEIAVYIQKSSFQFDDLLYFLTAVEPARFNFPKPPTLALSDDAWAALQLRVDHAARNILDPHRYYAAALCVGFLIIIVFYAIRPGYDRRRIHALNEDREGVGVDDDEIYDDYLQDDLWERNHKMDDVVVAELDYLNAELDKSLWIWRCGLAMSLAVLFGSVVFLAVLMERRNMAIDDHIRRAIEEIRPRVEDEGIAVEYRTRSSFAEFHDSNNDSSENSTGSCTGAKRGKNACSLFFGKYIRPTRVVVFSYLDTSSLMSSPSASQSGASPQGQYRPKKTGSFFSEDYQRKYFPPRSIGSIDEFSVPGSSTAFSII